MEKIISGHNKGIFEEYLTSDAPPQKTCSCPGNQVEPCILEGRCLEENIVYQATVTSDSDNSNETYTGVTEPPFKLRYAVHKQSIKNKNSPNSTALSKYIWNLKDNKTEFKISYKIVGRGHPYNPRSGKCGLCLKEKTIIITKPKTCTLNKRNEFVSKCPHRDKYLLLKVPD